MTKYWIESHPSRVRELKPHILAALIHGGVSHPSRVRELKQFRKI